MSADLHAMLDRKFRRPLHGRDVSRMEAARDIRRSDVLHQFGIAAAALAHVAIKIDA
jgi:hypothetical protein